MKYLYLYFILVTFSLSAQKRFNISLQSEGREREAIISVPTKSPPIGGYPIVFMLHGTSGDSEVFYNAKGWKELGQEENFITIFPSSLKWCFYNRFDGRTINSKFVCGDLLKEACENVDQKFVDELTFFKKLVKLVSDTVEINSSKIFASGFSNGSVMIHKLMTHGSDLFKAVAGSSGPLFDSDSLISPVRIPAWYMVGTKDDRYFSESFPEELPFGGDTILAYHYPPINRALVCNGLTWNYEKVESALSHTYIFRECAVGEQCAPYIFTLNKGQSHQYPNGLNFPFDAPKLFWQFFNNPPETKLSTRTEVMARDQVKVYPIPSSDKVSIDYNHPIVAIVQIFNQAGQIVFSKKTEGYRFEILKSEVGNGIFVGRVISEQEVHSFRFIFE